MRVAVIQHAPFEGPGAIRDWARGRGHQVSFAESFQDGRMPDLDAFDFLVLMGGPMSANDDLPWLTAEKELLRRAIDAEKPILGVCLGAQLLASVLGAKIFKNKEKEIGWFPIHFDSPSGPNLFDDFPNPLDVLHWHGETFDLPAGARALASSDACRLQAFQWEGRVLGMQFHMEVQADGIEALIEHCPEDLEGGRHVQSAGQLRAGLHNAAPLGRLLGRTLDSLAVLAETSARGVHQKKAEAL